MHLVSHGGAGESKRPPANGFPGKPFFVAAHDPNPQDRHLGSIHCSAQPLPDFTASYDFTALIQT